MTIITSTQAAAFRTVANTQSATAAARALYVSVPTIWRYIKKLESEIGEALFYRPGYSRLTPAGKMLLKELR